LTLQVIRQGLQLFHHFFCNSSIHLFTPQAYAGTPKRWLTFSISGGA
jgi:hypothetical protein